MKIFVYTEYNELFIRQINEEREKSILKFLQQIDKTEVKYFFCTRLYFKKQK